MASTPEVTIVEPVTLVTVTLPALPAAPPLPPMLWLAESDFDRAPLTEKAPSPPPPPMDCSSTPVAEAPEVEIAPALYRLTSLALPPDEPPPPTEFDCELPVPADNPALTEKPPTPPPPPIDWANTAMAESPLVWMTL